MNEAILNSVAVVLAGVITVLGGMGVQALRRLAAKLNLQADAQVQTNIALNQNNTEAQVATAIKVGVTTFLPLIQEKGWNSPEVHAKILEKATDYLAVHFPDKTAQILAAAQPVTGDAIEKGTPAATAAVSETIAARIPQVITEIAASPATPPVTTDPAAPPMVAIVATPTAPVVSPVGMGSTS